VSARHLAATSAAVSVSSFPAFWNAKGACIPRGDHSAAASHEGHFGQSDSSTMLQYFSTFYHLAYISDDLTKFLLCFL
jgi:hypothetical protein